MSYFTEFLEKNGLRMEENVQLTFEVIRLIADEYDRVIKARESENEKSSMETQIQTSKLQVDELKTENKEFRSITEVRNLESDLKQLNLVKNRVDIVSAIEGVTTARSESTGVAEEETARAKDVKYSGLDPSTSESTNQSKSASTTTDMPAYYVRRYENVWQWSAIKRNNFTASGVAEDKKLDVICNYFKE